MRKAGYHLTLQRENPMLLTDVTILPEVLQQISE